MSESLTSYLHDRIAFLEKEYGFSRDCVAHNGKYIVRAHPGMTKKELSREAIQAMGNYETLVAIDERFGSAVVSHSDRAFFDKIQSNHIPASAQQEDLMLEVLEASTKLLRLSRIESVTGRRKNAVPIANLCNSVASMCMRIRDIASGFVQVDEKEIRLNSNG